MNILCDKKAKKKKKFLLGFSEALYSRKSYKILQTRKWQEILGKILIILQIKDILNVKA